MPTNRWKSILVAVADPAARQQLAVRKAARLATASGARLTLFHAFSQPFPLPQPLPSSPEAILRAVAKQKRAQLEQLAEPLRRSGLRMACEVAWDFPPAQAIVRRVLAGKPDLLVAGSHRHTRLGRWFLANADWDLIRECPCPVWFVKRDRLGARPLIVTAVDPSHAHAKPSGLDERLLKVAGAVREQLDGRMGLIHVEDVLLTAPLAFLPALPAALLEPPGVRRAAARRAVARLARRHGIAADAALVWPGLPAKVIPVIAAKLGTDVLVMGAVSRSGLSKAFIGSTAEAVIDAVGCDVLIVKPRGFRTTVPRRAPRLGRPA
jgi:universal stress protein E